GTITFKDGNTVLKVVTVSGGKASFSTNKLAVSTTPHFITATYNLTNTTSNQLSFIVKAKTKSAEIATAIAPDVELADLKVYPNPFNEKLRFEFVSPESVNARIDLYDMTGRLVKNIFEQPIEGGTMYNAEFKPDAIISGMYFYRMTIGEAVFNGKVVFKKE
ncbi:MAG TPA: T9SS type A sorting domain-containing protein, partial [Draconibacterium sp.]|nr:T9SS type A sorting domain-containing protein [Draconibacterium sp.]